MKFIYFLKIPNVSYMIQENKCPMYQICNMYFQTAVTHYHTVRATSFMRVPRSTVEFCPSKHRGLSKLSEPLKSFEVYREISTARLRGTPCDSVEFTLAVVGTFVIKYFL